MKNSRVRLLVATVLIVSAALTAGLLHLGSWGIAAAVSIAWGVTAVIEYVVSKRPGDDNRTDS